jgi:4-amino-4-deoxy-L-arabinose transferase-like glycosyltransferase
MRQSAILLLLVFFAVVYATTLNSYGMFTWDEAEYASLARSVVRGEGFTISGEPNPLRPPMFPLAAAVSLLLCGGGQNTVDTIVKLPSLAFSLLTLFVVYWCATTVYEQMTGLVAATFLGVSPLFWLSTPFFLTDIPFIAFFTAAVVFFYFGLYHHQRYFSWSWGCWGIAFLTRYTAVLFAPIVGLFLILAFYTRTPEVRQRIWSGHFFLGPCVGVLMLVPWLLRQQFTFGNALVGMQQAAIQLQVYRPDVSMPWYFYLMRLPGMLSPGVAVLALIGAIWTVWKREWFGAHCLGACAVILGWMSCYRYKEARFAMAILPFMAIMAAVGLTKPFFPMQGSLRSWAVLVPLLVSLFVINFRANRPIFRSQVTLGYPSFLDAMRFLREHSSPDAEVIGANHPQISWYADRRARDFPDEPQLKEMLENSDWIVLSNFERGQKSYARDLDKKVTRADVQEGNAVVFRDRRFRTVLIRSSLLRKRL